MFKQAAVAAVALAGVAVEAYSLQKRDGAGGHGHGGHDHGGGAAAPAPASGYDEPSAGYGAPSPGYGAPSPGYGAPSPSYGTPQTGYAAEPTGYGEVDDGGFPDLTPIIIGVLALVGLSLLFPTFVSISSVRRKRSTAEESNPMTEVVDRVSDIYNAVVTSEGCMERIACEVGGLAGDFGMQDFLPEDKVAAVFMPKHYKGIYNKFKSGKDCHKIKCLY